MSLDSVSLLVRNSSGSIRLLCPSSGIEAFLVTKLFLGVVKGFIPYSSLMLATFFPVVLCTEFTAKVAKREMMGFTVDSRVVTNLMYRLII